ncbi:MAG: class I SAM-dependent methyltransferase [Deltaproteobacteria bacterium]|nr:class I SAM-dependent methyltransferase [Deltaproteobacteria bacterium]MBW2128674.1 class I SAM-dependent methyltransferase [Deltaproteobacteria bacterium]MBW2302747.1 class I SAM-dependent methyltransferase [Deltaproteobacteria bacterium]
MDDHYYKEKLSAERLRRCYEIAPPRVKQYLEAEIAFVLERIRHRHLVLELGCGYGRVLKRILGHAQIVVGIDNSLESLALAREEVGSHPACRLAAMDASRLGFRKGVFHRVLCIQNGISAFKVEPRRLVQEALRVTRRGGKVLFSSYSHRFWNERLEWFQRQAEQGLLGEIDYEATGNGVIVCKDGFRATTFGAEEFLTLASDFDVSPLVMEVDESSIFCEMTVLK